MITMKFVSSRYGEEVYGKKLFPKFENMLLWCEHNGHAVSDFLVYSSKGCARAISILSDQNYPIGPAEHAGAEKTVSRASLNRF